jgi:anti-anti-sigma factor
VSLSAPETGNDAAVFAELAVHLDRSERRITVCGEIDFAAVPVLADAMYQLIDLEPGDSTIDLAGVSFIAAAGLGCLVGFANQLANSDAKITVVGASDRLPANSRSERRHPWFVVRGMPERVKHATESAHPAPGAVRPVGRLERVGETHV